MERSPYILVSTWALALDKGALGLRAGEHLGVGAPGGCLGILPPNTASPGQPGGQIRRGGKGTTFVASYSGASFVLRLETGSW